MTRNSPTQLTRLVKRLLDLLRILSLALVIVWPLGVVGITLSQHPGWGVDVGIFSRFAIDLDALGVETPNSTGIRGPEISGRAVVNFDTSSRRAWYVFAAITEAGGLFALYLIAQLRAIFVSLERGAALTQQNAGRVRGIGIAVIAWYLALPVMQYFGGRAALSYLSFDVPGLRLQPAFELNGLGLLVGLAIVVLAGVLLEAAGIRKEQELTI